MNSQFSFIILTYNEEIHLPRLIESIRSLNAAIYVLDSGSTDNTISIARNAGAKILQNAFENHPKQWDFALKNFDIQTPWIICLDADQVVTPQLYERLAHFKDEDYRGIDGIYFSRKNFFKGRWIKHGGYYPFYLLKMIRFGTGYSDLNENMDHRFIVPGKTLIWKNGYILEENLKENKISFWIDKHNRYSNLVAIEEVERMAALRKQTIKPKFWGSPDERTAWLKQLWWKLPRYVRPMIYFSYRMIFQLGILDGATGIIFHFLQGFWFRLVVDIKIDEILQAEKKSQVANSPLKDKTLKFVIVFVLLFLFLYYFNLTLFSFTSPTSRHYSALFDNHFNYIRGLRTFLLSASSKILNWMGYPTITDDYYLLVAGRGSIKLIYSCLGLGVISFFSAFVISYPKKWQSKIFYLIAGIVSIEFFNIIRFVVLALYWDKRHTGLIDHHTIFNLFIYAFIIIYLYLWATDKNPLNKKNETN